MRLRRFRSTSSTTASSPHDFYSISCECGKVVEGERTANSQQVRCSVCDAVHYVLPQDVYPAPQIVKTPPPEPVAKTITFASADEPAAKQETQQEDAPELELQDEFENRRLAEPVDLTPKRVWLERPSGKTIRKQLFRVLMAAGVLLLLTAWGISHRNEIRNAERAFQLHHEQAISYTDEGLWAEALSEAEQGVKAARLLGRGDAASAELFTLWKELDIIQNLSSLSPIEIVLQKQENDHVRDDWIRQFRIRHSGSWVILDALVERETNQEPDSRGKQGTTSTYRFDFPVGLPGEDVRFVWSQPPSWFTRLAYRGKTARVLVAAKLEAVRFPDKDSERWEMVLSAEDSHLWTNSRMLDKVLGISSISDVNRELNALIESQKKITLQAEAVP